ncbi:MAG: DUF3244 domain-containing protein [Lachnospiraceae bacterium]|nr:DUF3244 domain-containing protein [Lachnospiraceae bacterium]
MRKETIFCNLQIVLLSLSLSFASVLNVYSSFSAEEYDIELNSNNWRGDMLTWTLAAYPFSATISNSNLIIKNQTPYYELTVSISNIQTDEKVCEMNIAKENSNYIIIPILNLEEGQYLLEIKDSERNDSWVFGYFDII